MTHHLDTTVTTLMQLFRDALVALIPVMDRAGIAWRAPQAYDDWDAICATLFEQIVANSIRYGLPVQPGVIRLPPWGVLRDTYADVDWIEADPGSGLVVVDLQTRETLFDTVLAVEVDGAGRPVRQVLAAFEEAGFCFHWRRDGSDTVLTDLRVPL